MANSPYISAALDDIGDHYAGLRIIRPQAESAMERSMHLYGQITPVIIGCEDGSKYEMVDGFKRMRAGRKLGYQALQARILPGQRRALKAAIIHLNAKGRTIADVETGMIIRSLCREDGLSQIEIAALLGRHKSYVCRRLRMAEQLSGEVLENLKLGLINITTARELVRLPRGNQAAALATIIKYRFTCREAHRLVSLLLKEPRWNHAKILNFPEAILTDRQPDRPARPRSSPFYGRLLKMEIFLATVSDEELNHNPPEAVLTVIARIQKALQNLKQRLAH